jgi:hypothetical protein
MKGKVMTGPAAVAKGRSQVCRLAVAPYGYETGGGSLSRELVGPCAVVQTDERGECGLAALSSHATIAVYAD